MAWDIEVVDGCAVVRMNTNKVNVQNDHFFADLHRAFDRLGREFSDLPVVLTGQGDVFSAGIDFQYSINALRALAPPSPRPRSQAITPPAPHTAAPLEPQAQRPRNRKSLGAGWPVHYFAGNSSTTGIVRCVRS